MMFQNIELTELEITQCVAEEEECNHCLREGMVVIELRSLSLPSITTVRPAGGVRFAVLS